jgi:hypothetical protein
MQLVTPKGEAAYAYVYKPQKAMQEGRDPQYSLTLLFNEGDPKLDKLRSAIIEVATAKFGQKAAVMLEKGQLKNPLRPGSDRTDENFEDKVFITARSTDKPQIVDEDAEPIMDQADFYSGCEARMDIYLYAFEKAGNKGVAAILNSAQKLGEGIRRSGRRSAQEAFKPLSEEDEALI